VFCRNPTVKIQDSGLEARGKPKERILASAIRLFAEKGYDKTSVREIVASAGVTKPVLYYHFKSKEGLLRTILDWAASLQKEYVADVMDAGGRNALDKCIYLAGILYRGVAENPNLFRMIHNFIFGPPQGFDHEVESFHRRLVDVIKRIYQEGFERGELAHADPEDVALLVLSTIDFCLHLNHVRPEFMDPDRSERLLRLVFRGVQNREGRQESEAHI
jgi:AcrR family transcriptional regulator